MPLGKREEIHSDVEIGTQSSGFETNFYAVSNKEKGKKGRCGRYLHCSI
jgi:hypothetical protein